MTFKPALWYPISLVLSVVNVVAIAYAAASAEPLHAAGHGILGVAFGLWAQRLRQAPRPNAATAPDARVGLLESEVSDLRRQLSQTQEGLDFAERLIAQRYEPQRAAADAPNQRAAVPSETRSQMSPGHVPRSLGDDVPGHRSS